MRKLLLLSPLFAVVVLGCSEGAKDRLTRFFFEVPDETGADAAKAEAGTPARETAPAVAAEARYTSVHRPYAEQQCSRCHDPEQRMHVVDDLAAACRACHERFFGEAVEHEPVAEGECAQCHQAHRSRFLSLLRTTVLESCTECHDSPEDLSEEAHGAAGVENCTACHDPHFGSAPYLKPQRGFTEPGGE